MVANDPYTIAAQSFLALILDSTEDPEERALWRDTVQDPCSAVSAKEIIDELSDRDYLDQAFLFGHMAYERHKGDPDFLFSYFFLLFDAGCFEEAIERCASLENDPCYGENDIFVLDYGICLFYMGRFGEAEERFRKYEALEDQEICKNLGLAFKEAGKMYHIVNKVPGRGYVNAARQRLKMASIYYAWFCIERDAGIKSPERLHAAIAHVQKAQTYCDSACLDPSDTRYIDRCVAVLEEINDLSPQIDRALFYCEHGFEPPEDWIPPSPSGE